MCCVFIVDVESPTQAFTDGLWHSFSLYMDATKVNVTVDRNVKVSERTMTFQPGTEYFLGMFNELVLQLLSPCKHKFSKKKTGQTIQRLKTRVYSTKNFQYVQ